MQKTVHNNSGFSMFEVITVLVVIGIVAAVSVSAVAMRQDLMTQADIVKAHLRFAQLKALQDDTASWGIVFSGGGYTLYNNNAPAAINLPSENSNSHFFPSGITITNSVIKFDSWGAPGPADVPLTLSQDTDMTTITVSATTGSIAP